MSGIWDGVDRVLAEGLRVALIAPRWDHGPELVRLHQQSLALHAPWIDVPVTVSEFAGYLTACSRGDKRGLVVRLRASGALAGVVSFWDADDGPDPRVEVGYHVGAGFERQGYMGEALALALRVAWRDPLLLAVRAWVHPENVASHRLLERLGFRQVGQPVRVLRVQGAWREHAPWELLRGEQRSYRLTTPSAGNP